LNIDLKKASVFLLFCLQIIPSVTYAYDFAIMPVRSKAKTEQLYKPLMNYLSMSSGQPITLKAYNNFVNYWQDMRDNKFDFALDAAHFVDYRAKQLEHQVLVKIKDQVSFSLVTTDEESILEPSELIGKPIACLPPPSRGNLEIDTFFKNPIRQPRKAEVKSYEEAVYKMKTGKVKAAVIPTSMLGAYPNLITVETTELWPHMGVTASPKVPTKVKSSVAKALLSLTRTDEGNKVLAAVGLPGFEPTDHSTYEGYSKYLVSYGRYNR